MVKLRSNTDIPRLPGVQVADVRVMKIPGINRGLLVLGSNGAGNRSASRLRREMPEIMSPRRHQVKQ